MMGEGEPEDHRVMLWFGEHLLRSYRADPSAATEYSKAISQHFPGVMVTVDKEAVEGLVRLPCEQLWTLTP